MQESAGKCRTYKIYFMFRKDYFDGEKVDYQEKGRKAEFGFDSFQVSGYFTASTKLRLVF